MGWSLFPLDQFPDMRIWGQSIRDLWFLMKLWSIIWLTVFNTSRGETPKSLTYHLGCDLSCLRCGSFRVATIDSSISTIINTLLPAVFAHWIKVLKAFRQIVQISCSPRAWLGLRATILANHRGGCLWRGIRRFWPAWQEPPSKLLPTGGRCGSLQNIGREQSHFLSEDLQRKPFCSTLSDSRRFL